MTFKTMENLSVEDSFEPSLSYDAQTSAHHGRITELPDDSGPPDKTSSRVSPVDVRPGDIVIALMGITGSGKSTFISHFAEKVEIGHNLESCTSDVAIYQGRYNDTTKIYFVDTPGFDDTHRSDSSILREIADWLSQAYGNDIKLTGIVYLHRIMDVRLGGSAMKNLRMFKKLCGENALQSVVLATTWWSSVDKLTGEQREQQLRTRDDFWAGMIAKGSKMFRQDRDAQSAREIVDYLVQKKNPVVLKVQEEMVDENKTLDETSAGIEVDTELAEQKKRFEADLRRLQEEMNATMSKKDAQFQEELEDLKRESEEVKKKMQEKDEERERLHKDRAELRAEMEFELEMERTRLMQQIQVFNQEAQERKHEMNMMEQRFDSKLKQQELQFKFERSEEKRLELEAQLEGVTKNKKKGPCVVM